MSGHKRRVAIFGALCLLAMTVLLVTGEVPVDHFEDTWPSRLFTMIVGMISGAFVGWWLKGDD